jgi:hypothetical protein
MSNIDTTVPVYGNPTTQSVRDNFATAATEIDAATALATGKLSDAPSDGNAYGRLGAQWQQVLPLAGGQMNAAIRFGSVAASSPTNLAHHLDLFGGTFGLCVTSARLNIVVPAGAGAWVNAGGVDVVQVQANGVFIQGGLRLDLGATLGSGVGDASHHITLYGGTGVNNYGIGVSTGSLNLISGNNFRLVDSSNANPLLQVNRNTATLFVPLALPADPTTALQAATKQYVDASPLVTALTARVAALEAALARANISV